MNNQKTFFTFNRKLLYKQEISILAGVLVVVAGIIYQNISGDSSSKKSFHPKKAHNLQAQRNEYPIDENIKNLEFTDYTNKLKSALAEQSALQASGNFSGQKTQGQILKVQSNKEIQASSSFHKQDVKLAQWLVEVSDKMNTQNFTEMNSIEIEDGSKIVEKATDSGLSIMLKYNSAGYLENDEVLMPDGRVLSRTYGSDGSLKEVYFEQGPEATYSVTFNESGHLSQMVSRVGDKLVSRKDETLSQTSTQANTQATIQDSVAY